MPPGDKDLEMRQGETFLVQFRYRNPFNPDGSKGLGIDLTGATAVFGISGVITTDATITVIDDPDNPGNDLWPIEVLIEDDVVSLFDFSSQDYWLRVTDASGRKTDLMEGSIIFKKVPR